MRGKGSTRDSPNAEVIASPGAGSFSMPIISAYDWPLLVVGRRGLPVFLLKLSDVMSERVTVMISMNSGNSIAPELSRSTYIMLYVDMYEQSEMMMSQRGGGRRHARGELLMHMHMCTYLFDQLLDLCTRGFDTEYLEGLHKLVFINTARTVLINRVETFLFCGKGGAGGMFVTRVYFDTHVLVPRSADDGGTPNVHPCVARRVRVCLV